MVYSKRVTDLQQIYQLTPDDVFFCMLVASGASRGEAYATIFVQYRDKDAVLSGLEQTLPYLRGKDRADVLMKIADLQQMKKDENTEEEETVHYYLPLQCYRCSLFIADRAKRKAEGAEKPDNI